MNLYQETVEVLEIYFKLLRIVRFYVPFSTRFHKKKNALLDLFEIYGLYLIIVESITAI